jgi:hypothetical protein
MHSFLLDLGRSPLCVGAFGFVSYLVVRLVLALVVRRPHDPTGGNP